MTPISEAIILAGGLGTRLRSVVQDTPKPLAQVAGRPFLDWLLDDLAMLGLERVILATGYGSDQIEDRYCHGHKKMAVVISRETTPLGTGGAIKLACRHVQSTHVLVLNGDTFAAWNPAALRQTATRTGAPITLGLKHLINPDRYGTVTLEKDRITSFQEKRPLPEGLINAGIYLMQPESIKWPSADKFSLERDILEPACREGRLSGAIMPGPFIDIGIPEAFFDAQTLIPRWMRQSHCLNE
jgi:D-glycero-alpha-D-manno-heptose 1-phosphate guanylyltransferase